MDMDCSLYKLSTCLTFLFGSFVFPMSIGLYNMLTALAYAKNDPRSYLNVSGKRTQGSSLPVWFIYVLLCAVFSSREDAVVS